MPPTRPLVIVAPLNWGLGHATRCVPIIRGLLERNCDVHIIAEGGGAKFLQLEFPDLEQSEFPGYEITYPDKGQGMMMKMVKSVPGILRGIRKEHECLEQLAEKLHPDAIISDNRFGLWHHRISTIFITHQVNIKAPFGETLLGMMNHKYIRKFNSCWIPDEEADGGLCGELGHRFRPSFHVEYIGTLSRFCTNRSKVFKDTDLFIILSGPEPQRSLLENILLEKIRSLESRIGKWIMIQGLPGEKRIRQENLGEIHTHMNDEALQDHVRRSKLIVTRSGYSTIMDLDRIGAKAAFIPTPGQTEQEYLAERMMERGVALCMKQGKIDLQYAIESAENYSGFPGRGPSHTLSKRLDELVHLFERKSKH